MCRRTKRVARKQEIEYNNAICHKSQRGAIQDNEKEKDEQVLRLQVQKASYVQTVQHLFFHILFVNSADITRADKY